MRVALINSLNIVKGDSKLVHVAIKVYFILPKILVNFLHLFFCGLRILFDENKCNIEKVILQNVPDSKEDSSE